MSPEPSKSRLKLPLNNEALYCPFAQGLLCDNANSPFRTGLWLARSLWGNFAGAFAGQSRHSALSIFNRDAL